MADFISPFIDDLRAVIGTGASDLLPANQGGGIWEVQMVQKVDWATITLPYCVFTMRIVLDTEAAITCDAYIATVEIYYIIRDTTDTAATIRTKMEAIRAAIKAYDFTTKALFLDILEFDNTELNAANRAFLQIQMPYSAGMMAVQFRIGETAN